MNYMYGIVFNALKLYDSRMLLIPTSHVVDGFITDELYLIDQYDKTYDPVSNPKSMSFYQECYAFPITKDKLKQELIKLGYSYDVVEFPDVCARKYLDIMQEYLFVLDDNIKGDTNCMAVDLNTKQVIPVCTKVNFLSQLGSIVVSKKDKKPSLPPITDDLEYVGEDSLDVENLYNMVTSRVIGQDDAALKLIATVVRNMKYGQYEGMKSNILMYGPSGCGKTELIRSLSRALHVPLVIEDMSTYTATGYVGDSVKGIIKRLYNMSGNDLKKTEKGIVFLDEVDKLAPTGSKESVNKTDVQDELLKLIEGETITITDSSSDKKNTEIEINTANITFILGGAFSKLTDKKKNRTIGFNSNEESNDEISNDSFVEFGLRRELIGRAQVKIPIKPLKVDDYEHILKSSSISSLRIYERALKEIDRVTVVYDDKDKFIGKIAQRAIDLGTGARGLKTVVDEVFMDAVREIGREMPNDRKLLMTSDTIDNPKAYALRKVNHGKRKLSVEA